MSNPKTILRSLPGYPWLPCPICGGVEGCDDIGWERARAAHPGLVIHDGVGHVPVLDADGKESGYYRDLTTLEVVTLAEEDVPTAWDCPNCGWTQYKAYGGRECDRCGEVLE
jgi:hypothetical protein